MLTGARRLEVGGMAGRARPRPGAVGPAGGADQEPPRARSAVEPAGARDHRRVPELPGRPYLFGRGGRTPFSGWSRCKERLDERIARQRAEQRLGRPLEAARSQRPRIASRRGRSTISAARRDAHGREGIAQPHIIEAVVGHVSGHKGGVAGTTTGRCIARRRRQGCKPGRTGSRPRSRAGQATSLQAWGRT